jgi:hypothetical protein
MKPDTLLLGGLIAFTVGMARRDMALIGCGIVWSLGAYASDIISRRHKT